MQYPAILVRSLPRALSFTGHICLLCLCLPAHSQSISQAKDIVGIQLRAQGIPCSAPSKATKDIQDSSRDEMAWIITCKEATYRVKLIPHVGSKVEIIDDAQSGSELTEMKE